MGKFNEVLEKQIEKKARDTEDRFFKEFESLLSKYGVKRNVMFDGLSGSYGKSGDRGEQWRAHLRESFVEVETGKFVSELSRLEHYFEKKEFF